MLNLSLTLAEAYSGHAAPDGFLYITYASQEVFGSAWTEPLGLLLMYIVLSVCVLALLP